jgi:cytochrome c oxidase subunit 2
MKRRAIWKLAACAAALLAVCAIGATPQNEETSRRIEITAKRFKFDPNEITVKRGESVVLAIHSTDVTHGLDLPDLGVKTDIPNGKVIEVPITPSAVGDFTGVCNHFCGVGHGSMTFTVHVVEQTTSFETPQ